MSKYNAKGPVSEVKPEEMTKMWEWMTNRSFSPSEMKDLCEFWMRELYDEGFVVDCIECDGSFTANKTESL